MDKIGWCKRQNKGIKLVNPSDNLCEEYYKNAEESLRVLRNIQGTESNMWLVTTKCYVEYFAVYSVLMKIRIKSEIHDCTIALVEFLENESVVEKGTSKILEKDKDLRIDNQYYLKNNPVNINLNELSDFLLSTKNSLDKLDTNKINEIRAKLEEF